MAKYRFQELSSSRLDNGFPHWGEPDLSSEEVRSRLTALQSTGAASVQSPGMSAEGREICSVTMGTGTRRVLLWARMHGDEPTHTVVMLELFRFLAESQSPAAKDILSNCTLRLIPVLNPDGAALGSRRNAQSIDINRDARQCRTPEGAILRKEVLEWKPEFAFNLHNHNPRRTIASTGKLAAVALLAPPMPPDQTDAPNLQLAKRLGSAFCESVASQCPNMMWRYAADYMPRAFGEWVQSQGVATLLVEAGGWPGPDKRDLLNVHLTGMLGALASIATGEVDSLTTDAYESLPQGAGYERYDCIIRNTVVQIPRGDSFTADLGINVEHTGLRSAGSQGTIVDVGDLSVHDCDCEVDAGGMVCSRGLHSIQPDISPTCLPDDRKSEAMLRQGVTTVVGIVSLADLRGDEYVANWRILNDEKNRYLLNVEFALAYEESATVEDFVLAASLGIVAICTTGKDAIDASTEGVLRTLGLARVRKHSTETDGEQVQCPKEEAATMQIKGFPIGMTANLVLKRDGEDEAKIVLVNGQMAFEHGKLTSCRAGRLTGIREG